MHTSIGLAVGSAAAEPARGRLLEFQSSFSDAATAQRHDDVVEGGDVTAGNGLARVS